MWTLIILVVIVVGVFWFVRKFYAFRWKMEDQHRITEEKVVEEWKTLLDKGANKADATMEQIARAIRAAKIPRVVISKKTVALGRDPRPFIVIEHETLKEYCMYVGALAYGDDRLNVVWYLVFDSPDIKMTEERDKAMRGFSSAMRRFGGPVGEAIAPQDSGPARFVRKLSLLDKLELSNYVGLVHGIVIEETKAMMEELNLDSTKIKTSAAKGFLDLA